jgi:hypothetical protein
MQTKDRQYIYNLAEKGFKFFPCSSVDKWKDGKNTGNRSKDLLVGKKAPLIARGLNNATNDIPTLKKYFEDTASWVGFPTGANNFNIVVIDVDLKEAVRDVNFSLKEFRRRLKKSKAIVLTPSSSVNHPRGFPSFT